MLQYKYEPEKNRIAVFQEGGKEVGEVTYFDHPDCWIANHTYVDPSMRGQNIAAELVKRLINLAREHGKAIYPTCSYVVKVMERTPEYQDVLYKKDQSKM